MINLIQLDTLPPLLEEKIRDAVRAVGGQDVTVRRVLRGDVRDDAIDTLVLEGRVPNQTALVRVLMLAAQLFTGQTITEGDIRVLADEAGGLTVQTQTQTTQTQLGGGATSSLFGGSRGSQLTNQIRTNLGRAKAVEAAGGRILSFIEVSDLPQVRVDIRLVEVNRTRLRSFNPNTVVATSDFRQPSLNPAQSATAVQGDQAARVGSSGAAIQNVLSFLNGGLLNELQYSGGGFAIDAALSLLEREGIAQSLSSPSLTVLSGELAQVQIGGEVPVPTAFAPAFGSAAAAAAPGHAGRDAGRLQLGRIRPIRRAAADPAARGGRRHHHARRAAARRHPRRGADRRDSSVHGDGRRHDGVPDPGASHQFEAPGRPGPADWRPVVEQYVHKYGVNPRAAGRAHPRAAVPELQPERPGH